MRISAVPVALALSLQTVSVPFRQQPGSPLSSTASASALHAPGEKILLPGIANAGKISDALFRGAQPDLSHLDELKKLGITTVVDLRSEAQGTREHERIRAQALGLHFISIPVGRFDPPTSGQLAQFFAVLRQVPQQKVFVHCQFGEDRTGVFIAAYRIAFEHWSSEEAMSEMLSFGFHRNWHPAMASFVRALPERLQSDATLKAALGP